VSDTRRETLEVTRTSPFEKLVERWSLAMAPWVPQGVTPNQITVFGCAAGCLGGVFFYLGGGERLWLLLAAAAMLVHLVADGLDGAVAKLRDRKSELGYFLDQFLDLIGFVAVVLGIAMSPLAHFQIVILGAVLYPITLVVTLHWINLRNRWIFPMIGPSDLWLLLAVFTVLTYLHPGPIVEIGGWRLGLMDLGFLAGLPLALLDAAWLVVRLVRALSPGKD
jgi:phosphatidylglycerophosphate synthase